MLWTLNKSKGRCSMQAIKTANQRSYNHKPTGGGINSVLPNLANDRDGSVFLFTLDYSCEKKSYYSNVRIFD